MRVILYLTSSPKGRGAFSRLVGDELLARLVEAHPGARVIHRDLATDPPPVPDAAFSAAVLGAAPDDDPAFATSEILIGELERCDALVIATPMHNYGVPAVLKAWIDQVVRIRRSFRSSPAGKVGMLRERPVFVVVASGGWFTGPSPSGTPAQPDYLTPYLRAVLGTIGLNELAFVTLEGVARGAEPAERALASARDSLVQLIPLPPM